MFNLSDIYIFDKSYLCLTFNKQEGWKNSRNVANAVKWTQPMFMYIPL